MPSAIASRMACTPLTYAALSIELVQPTGARHGPVGGGAGRTVSKRAQVILPS
jgi:hypothetical protein